jgi:hypothetical protein
LLVKPVADTVKVVFICVACGSHCVTEVQTVLVHPVCEMFREAGNPLIMLPPQGDLPWPAFERDDIIDFNLHIDTILNHLLEEN